MAMKLRGVIMRPEHTNDIFTIKKKMMVNEKLFKRGNAAYEINNDHFQVTFDKPWWMLKLIKVYYTTYYYVLNNPKPLPVPNFGIGKVESGYVEGEELANMFEAWLWRTIAGGARTAWDNMQFYISVATLCGVVYLIWKGSQGEPPSSADAPLVGGGAGP